VVEPLRPVRGGFLRPFGCGWFIREFLMGNGPYGSPSIDADIGAPQADIFHHYKMALIRATALDRATRTEEKIAQRQRRPINPDSIERLAESAIDNIPSEELFIRLCRKRSVFTDEALSKHWNLNRRNRPFIVNFLYVYSFPRRINLQRLIEIGVIPTVNDAPRGFIQINVKNLKDILRECQVDESIVVN